MLPIQTILHPTDFSHRSDSAFRLACALASDYHAQLVLLHVAQPPTFTQLSDEHQQELLAKLWSLSVPGHLTPPSRRLEEGNPADEVLRVAQIVHADLIIMGAHERHNLGLILHGSVAEKVTRLADCPVMTVTIPYFSLAPEELATAGEAVHS